MKSFLILALLLSLSSLTAAPARYVSPNSEIPLLRRDLLPLDPDRIRLLSTQITNLLPAPKLEDPADYRAHAQLVLLALQLDPTNPRAQKIDTSLAQEEALPPLSRKERAQAAAYLWQSTQWLLAPEAPDEAQKLGQLLLTPLTQLDPDHPAPADRLADERLWLGAIAPLRDFGAATPAPSVDPEMPPGETPAEPSFFKLETATLNHPTTGTYQVLNRIHERHREARVAAKTAGSAEPDPLPFPPPAATFPISLAFLSKEDHHNPYAGVNVNPRRRNFRNFATPTVSTATSSFVFHEALPVEDAAALEAIIRPFFTQRGIALPEDLYYFVNASGNLIEDPAYLLKSQRRRGDNPAAITLPEANIPNLATPIALLLDSCHSGEKLRSDTVLLARLQPDGSLQPAAESWTLLNQLLHHNPELRIILPAAAEDQLTALTLFRQSEKLLKTQVILADSYDEARPFLFEGGQEPAELATALSAWREVDEKRPDSASDLNAYLSLAGVHAKLKEALGASPRLLSAKHLCLVGSKDKATRLSTATSAMELHSILSEIPDILFLLRPGTPSRNDPDTIENDSGNADLADGRIKALEQRLEALQPIIDFDDRQLLIDATDLVERMSTITRTYRANKKYLHHISDLVERGHDQQVKLAELASYPEPPEPRIPNFLR
ncbi:MAG: hypothetical protein ACQKBY_07275 [Verrucomicrobiales bacterium]